MLGTMWNDEKFLINTANRKFKEQEVEKQEFLEKMRLDKRRIFLNQWRCVTIKLEEDVESKNVVKFGNLKQFCQTVGDFTNPKGQLESLRKIRSLLTVEDYLPIDEIIDAGLLPILRHCISFGNDENLQFEATWILTNLASGNSKQTNKIVEANCVPYLIHLLRSENWNLVEQSMWALGNIIGDSAELRDYVLKYDIYVPIIQQIKANTPKSYFRIIAWITLNLCRHRNSPLEIRPAEQILNAISVLIFQTDCQVLVNLLWATSLIADTSVLHIEKILECGFIPRVITLTGHQDDQIKLKALYVLGNIATGKNEHIQYLLKLNVLFALRTALLIQNESIRKTIFWILSNLTAGHPQQIQTVFDAGFIPIIINELKSGSINEKLEILWCIQNITVHRSKSLLTQLIKNGLLKPLCELFTNLDTICLELNLEIIRDIFETLPDQTKDIMDVFIATGGIDKLQKIHQHDNVKISLIVNDILSKQFW